MVGRGNMGVGADDKAGAAIDEVTETLLLTGGLGMKIDDRCIALLHQWTSSQFALTDHEGVVEIGVHENTTHDVCNENPCPVARDIDTRAATRRAGGIVGWSDKAVMAFAE